MRAFRGLVAALALAALLAGPAGDAQADDVFTAAADARFDETVEAPPAHFAQRTFADLTSYDTLQAELRVLKLDPDRKWGSSVSIFVEGGGRSVRLRLRAGAAARPMTGKLETALVDTVSKGEASFSARVALGVPVALRVHWTADGRVSATLAGETLSADLGAAPQQVLVIVSGATASFTPLQLGRTTPAS